jgi:hypothetical protein
VEGFRKATKAEIEAAFPHLAACGVRVDLLDPDLLSMTFRQRAEAARPVPKPADREAWDRLRIEALEAIQRLERYLNARGLSAQV